MNVKKRIWVKFAFVTLVATVFSACSESDKVPETPVEEWKRFAIVDAGSGGSRLEVFEYNDQTFQLRSIFHTESAGFVQARALTSVPCNADSLAVLMDSITYHLPQKEEIDLYMIATAGMRLQDGTTAEKYYSTLRGLKPVNGYRVKDALTLNGQYEALYAWLAVNYPFTAKSLDGILEMGGTSMQVAFPMSKENAYTLSRPCASHIYCRSYLGAGKDVLFDNYTTDEIEEYLAKNVEDPSALYGDDLKFQPQGKSMIKLFSNTTLDNVDKYIDSLRAVQTEPETSDSHTVYTTIYLTKLIQHFKVADRINFTGNKCSWTLGAAIDIALYHQQPAHHKY